MNTMTKPMSAPMLVQCLAGEFYCDPYLLVEAIKEEESALVIVRQYGKGLASYDQVKAKIAEII